MGVQFALAETSLGRGGKNRTRALVEYTLMNCVECSPRAATE